MKGASLDGRNRKPSSAPATTAPSTPKRDTNHLRPASPPRQNPWARLAPITTKKSKEFPSLGLTPEEGDAAEEDDDCETCQSAVHGDGRQDGSAEQETIAPARVSAGDQDETGASQIPAAPDENLETASEQKAEDPPSSKVEDETISDEEPSIASSDHEKSAITSLEEKQVSEDEQPESRVLQIDAHAARKEASFSSEGIQSPTTLSCTSEPTSDAKGSPFPSKDRMSDSASNCSSESRRFFVAAAAKANANLFYYGVGADVLVHAETLTYTVHRQLLVEHSAWFRHHLPPPNEDGSPVRIYLPFAAGAVGPCLSYIYTNRIDVCERISKSIDAAHLPRCVLGYCAAVTLRMRGLCSHLLRVVQATMLDFAEYFSSFRVDQKEGQALVFHLFNAFKIIHGEPCYRLVRPMRLALAGVLDGILACLIRHEALFYMLALPAWKEHGPSITTDMMEYRTLESPTQCRRGKLPISENDMDAVFEGVWSEDAMDEAMAKSSETLRPDRQNSRV